MLTDKINDAVFVKELQHAFATAQPYKHVVIDEFLDVLFAQALAEKFPLLENMKTRYNGINEKKAEHSELNSLSPEFNKLKNLLFDENFISFIEQISGIETLEVFDDRFGYGLHQGGNGSFLDIHIDYNLHPLKKKQRRLNLLIFLNEQWEKDWGGLLQFWNADVTECIMSITPKFNRCVLFECSDISYHGYNQINCPPSITRKSFYTYFFSVPVGNPTFHDTVFKPLPHESAWKKLVVSGKENVKNNVKRILYKIGLMKLFK
jgi:Rps23 Pro-64 3,4-dihydroxylase Tpa1-like proline 4-hydroxylase